MIYIVTQHTQTHTHVPETKLLLIFSFAMHVCLIIFSILNELKYSKHLEKHLHVIGVVCVRNYY